MIRSEVLAKTIRKFEKTFKNLFLVAFISETKVLKKSSNTRLKVRH